ncbi:unnamed protein product [Brassica oleracea]
MSQIKTIHNLIGSLEKLLDLLLLSLIIFMTLKGGTSGACSACKYQRRRCATDCPLAPYFPAEQPKIFQNVHSLFGVRSIIKILENLDEAQKLEAMKSIIFQSYVRDRNPIHGCLGITQQLQYMIWLAEEELKMINSQLQIHRNNTNTGQYHHNAHNQMSHEIGEKLEDVTSQLNLGVGLMVNNNQNNTIPFFSPLPVFERQPQQPQMCYTYSSSEINNNGYSSPVYTDSCKDQTLTTNNNNVDASLAWGQNRFPYHHNNGFSNQNEHCNEMKSNNGVTAIQSQLVNHQMVSNQQDEVDDVEYDEIHQFLEIIDDKQSFPDTKLTYASSSGESLKECTDETGESELRSAATCLSLTSVN